MFPQQQPQQHFQQQLLQLQQLIHQQRQQQHPHRHPHPHPHPPQGGPGRGVPQQQQHHHPHPQQHPPPPPPPQQQPPQHLNIGPATQPSLINPNPMLHRALIMQQMQGSLRGYGMTAPGLQPFFPPGSRASILGTPPLGIQLQTPRIRFGNQLFQQQHRRFNKDFKRIQDMRRDRYPPREPFRAKVAEKHDANKSNVASVAQESTDDKVADTKKEADCIPLETESSSQTDEPEVKRRRLESENDDDLTNQSGTGEPTTSKSKLQGEDMEKETSECEESGADQNLEHNAANTEMLSTVSTLKVTIQQSSESRAISTSVPDSGTKGSEDSTEEMDSIPTKFICYICNANCYNQKNFQKHMNGTRHHQRLMEIQQMSNACLATLIPKSGAVGRGRDGDKKRPRWCSTCQAHFRGNVIEHRRTQRHKVKLQRSSQDKDQAGQDDPEDLITVDAVGCFDEDDEEGMTEEDDDSISDCLSDKDSQQALLSEFEQEPYDAEAVYGQEFVVPVTGFLCKLCHKFYHSESTARFTHCKSLMHFQNLQSYKAQRAQDYSSASVQEPAPSGESSLGSTDDHKPGDEKQVETDNKSPEAATSKTQTEQESSESEVQAPSTSGDGTVPQVDKDDASESQCVQLENPSDGTGLISSGTSDCKLSNDEAPNSPKEVVEKMASPDKCEASSVTGNEAVDDEHDGNEECDPSLTKAEEPSEAEDGEEEAITDGCLADKEGEEVNVKGEDTEAELEDDCGHLERNTPKTRSGRAARGRRLSSRRKK
ncbi:cdkn1a interacting zinc finger protein 1a isoform X2 [Mustelus asterias]